MVRFASNKHFFILTKQPSLLNYLRPSLLRGVLCQQNWQTVSLNDSAIFSEPCRASTNFSNKMFQQKVFDLWDLARYIDRASYLNKF